MNNADIEMLRNAVLETLAARHPTAASVAGITRAVVTSLPFVPEPSDVAGALEFHKSKGWAESVFNEMGASKYWRATADGLLVVERARA